MSKFEINRSGGFFIINVNVILTLQLSPHVAHFDISTGFRYKKMEKSSPSIYRDVHGQVVFENVGLFDIHQVDEL